MWCQASSGSDGTLRIWNLEEETDNKEVKSLAILPKIDMLWVKLIQMNLNFNWGEFTNPNQKWKYTISTLM